jgi:hypothetical protein
MDKSKFKTEPYFKKVDKPWGYEFVFAPTTSAVTGKILHINEGKRFSLQYHDKKEEVLTLVSGRATLSKIAREKWMIWRWRKAKAILFVFFKNIELRQFLIVTFLKPQPGKRATR